MDGKVIVVSAITAVTSVISYVNDIVRLRQG